METNVYVRPSIEDVNFVPAGIVIVAPVPSLITNFKSAIGALAELGV